MKKFYRVERPIVQAVQWNGDNFDEVVSFLSREYVEIEENEHQLCVVGTDGFSGIYLIVNIGDWIYRDGNIIGSMKDDEFRKKFMPVESWNKIPTYSDYFPEEV